MKEVEKLKRWRLILGKESEAKFDNMNGNSSLGLSEKESAMDKALEEIYSSKRFGELGGNAGKTDAMPKASQWMGDIRSLFDKDIVKIIQQDAIERCGLKQLLLEPEVLEQMEPNIELASTILAIRSHVPEKSKDSVRLFIYKLVEQINKMLEGDIKRVIRSAMNRLEHSPIPSASAIDFKYTINKNLKNYNKELNTIIPDKVFFFDRVATSDSKKWTVILDVDRSGSMGESVIYCSVLSAILASIASIKTKVVVFNDEVINLTDQCSDPVDLLYGFEIGGGTDINKSVNYCQTLIENPSKTMMFMVTDLYENGNVGALLARLRDLKDDGVTVVCLLAITDSGKPSYNIDLAQKISNLSIPCFACSPQKLPLLLDCILHHRDLSVFEKSI